MHTEADNSPHAYAISQMAREKKEARDSYRSTLELSGPKLCCVLLATSAPSLFAFLLPNADES